MALKPLLLTRAGALAREYAFIMQEEMTMRKKTVTAPEVRAYCYASGLIEFGKRMPSGCLPLAKGPEALVKEFIDAVCRHGYKTELVDGRPTKIAGTEQFLVPGIPEAGNQFAALTALHKFQAWIRTHKAPTGVEVL